MAESSQEMSALQLLSRLESEVTQRLQAIAGIRIALGLEPWAPSGVAAGIGLPEMARDGGPGQVRSDEFFRMTIPEAIKKFLSIMRKPQSPKAIADGLQAGGVLSNAKKFYSNITTAIGRMEASGVIVNTPNGWGLSEWYPARPRAPEQGQKKSRRRKPPTGKQKASAKSLSAYQQFMAEARKAGKDLKQISEEWSAMKEASK